MERGFNKDSSGGDVPPPTAKRTERRVENDTIDSGRDELDEPWKYRIRKERKGLFLIFNHEIFDDSKLPTRKGTDADKRKLEKVWGNLGFTVKTHDDLTVTQIRENMKRYSTESYHSEYDCFGLAVLTHGAEEDKIYARDGCYDIHELFEPFRDCRSLIGKPKLFFIQACRGTKLDHGHKMKGDAVDAGGIPNEFEGELAEDEVAIPRESDFLIAYSTVEGYYSWRDQRDGSWFIQKLNECIEKYASKWDLMTILTQVSRELSMQESCTDLPGYSGKKQCPSIVSRLTGLIYLTSTSVSKGEVTDHPSTLELEEGNILPPKSELNFLQCEDTDVDVDEYYRIQLEILKKKKEMIELKEKLCRAKLRKVTFEM